MRNPSIRPPSRVVGRCSRPRDFSSSSGPRGRQRRCGEMCALCRPRSPRLASVESHEQSRRSTGGLRSGGPSGREGFQPRAPPRQPVPSVRTDAARRLGRSRASPDLPTRSRGRPVLPGASPAPVADDPVLQDPVVLRTLRSRDDASHRRRARTPGRAARRRERRSLRIGRPGAPPAIPGKLTPRARRPLRRRLNRARRPARGSRSGCGWSPRASRTES